MTAVSDPFESSTPIEARRAAAVDYLLSRINYERFAVLPYTERHLKLDRMRTLLQRLGNPDAGMPIVHIAGTKGKGSTSALVAAMLHAAGYDVGVFSSPHLERVEERFCVNGSLCTPEELVALMDRIRPVADSMDELAAATRDPSHSPSYFELTTAIALMHFAQRNVDVAVLEVGLGGRLDSTNVCQPAITVITSISLDHTKQLGDTIGAIAAEKAGIIKPGVPLVLGPVEAEARQVIVDIARQRGARVIEAGVAFQFDYQSAKNAESAGMGGSMGFKWLAADRFEIADAPLRMLGRHQAANGALALAVMLELRRQGWLASTDAMRAGLAAAVLPGRIEVVRCQPTVVLDVSHNVASVEALVRTLDDSFAPCRRTLLFAASRDKDVPGMLRALLPKFDRIIATEFHENPRTVPAGQIVEWVGDLTREMGRQWVEDFCVARPGVAEAWSEAIRGAGRDDLVCITGSFFIAAEMRPLVTSEDVIATAP